MRRVEAGAGEPAVVLEAGLNNGAASWHGVMPLLAPHLRVAAYDRAGLGGSDPAPGLVTIDRQIDDLASVIIGLAAGPCVLAGHSWGGILVQLLAFRRPDLAAGLVLVDPGHEEMGSLLPLPLRWGWRIMRAVFPDELHGDAPLTVAALRELRAAATPFPDVPVVVLSAARGSPRRFRPPVRAYLPRRPAARSSRPVPAVAVRWVGRGSARPVQRAGTGSAERLVQNPGTTLVHLPVGRLSSWSGQYLEPSGGVDACGEAEKSLRQFVGRLHRCVVADAVE